jgi:predicted phosphodiesterase
MWTFPLLGDDSVLVAVLSDIHGNLPALDAVLDDAASRGIKTYWCLGDVFGYGPWPIQCWKCLRGLGIAENAWVIGNHELGLVNRLCREYYSDGEARIVLDYHYRVCVRDYSGVFDQIKRMKAIVQPMPGVILAHGVPKPDDDIWTVTKYTRTKFDAEQALNALATVEIAPQLIVVGHSHKAVFWRRAGGQNERGANWTDEDPEGEVSLGDLSRQPVYLNPGSVGQPRDQGREARYCYIDWDRMTVCFRRVPYPVELTREKMKKLEYPQALIDRWYSGSCKDEAS